MGIINQYPYTDLHSINLDYVIKLCRENMGLHLEISGNQLLLKTEAGNVISSVTIHYAEEAGHAATATSATSAASATNATNAQNATYATNAAHAVSADTATVAASANQAASATTAASAASADYATTAGSAATATRATSAASADYAESTGSVDHAEKAIETVVSSGNNLIFTTYDGTQITITAPYSTKANRDNNGNVIASTYIAGVVDDNGTLKFLDGNGNTVVSITPTSASAASDTYGNTIADFVKTITAPNDSNYITVSHGTGTAETLTVNYSNQAWKDTNGNVIKNTYIKELECVEDENDGHYKLVAYNGDDPQAELFRIELKAYSAQYADEAAHAVTADSATNADHATSADNATTADSAATAATATVANGLTGYKDTVIVKAKILSTDPLPVALNVGDDCDYETDIDDNTFFGYLTHGQAVNILFVDEYDSAQFLAPLVMNNSPFLTLFALGQGPRYYTVTNSTVYSQGIKISRMM